MIEKWYCLKCDECGAVIDWVEHSSIEKAVNTTKANSKIKAKITKQVNGAYHFVCNNCLKKEKELADTQLKTYERMQELMHERHGWGKKNPIDGSWVCPYCGKKVYSMEVHSCNQPYCGVKYE